MTLDRDPAATPQWITTVMTLDRDPAETPRWGVFTMHEQYGRPLVYRVGSLWHVGLSISSATGVAVICGWLAFAGPHPDYALARERGDQRCASGCLDV